MLSRKEIAEMLDRDIQILKEYEKDRDDIITRIEFEGPPENKALMEQYHYCCDKLYYQEKIVMRMRRILGYREVKSA